MIFNHGGERNRERKPDFYGFIFFFFLNLQFLSFYRWKVALNLLYP